MSFTASKSKLLRRILPAVSVLMAGTAIASAAGPRAVDPLFGLKYDTAAVHFEAADPGLTTTCTDLTNAKYDRKLFVFASVEQGDAKYLVVGGFYVPRKKAEGPAQTDPIGAIVEIKGGACSLIGPARETFDAPEDNSPAALRALASDAACRYSRAFGSHAGFVAALRRQRVSLTEKASPILSKATAAPLNCH